MNERASIAGLEAAPSVARRGAGRRLPARLGDYELFDHIGKGGMADIYRARRAGEFGVVRQLVVKEILPELARSPELSEMLASEAKTASKLEHANVVRIEDLQRDESTLFIAMEYVDGLDLRDLCRKAAKRGEWIPKDIALRIVIELLRALDYAHKFRFDDGAVGIVHRDVSPSNVLLSFEGEVKLCDFGIAKSYEGAAATASRADDARVLDGMVEGKAGYMSPEQAHAEPLDGRADIFASGIILWELLTGRRFYKAAAGESLFDVARRAEVRPLPPLGLPHEDELGKIVARALCRDRAERYPTAGQMQRELEAYAARAGLLSSTLKLRSFLEQGFSVEIAEARKKRELATRAMARGDLARLAPVAVAPELTPTAPPATTVPAAPRGGSRSAWVLVALALLVLAACAAVLIAR